jgi:hypothetical protein
MNAYAKKKFPGNFLIDEKRIAKLVDKSPQPDSDRSDDGSIYLSGAEPDRHRSRTG